jgi:phosphoglycerate dehydrogenase-like enzyme
MTGETFRVGFSRDLLLPDGRMAFGDIGLDILDAVPGLTREFLADDSAELTPEQIANYDALFLGAGQVTESTLAGNSRLAIVARFGVGYDNVDVEACTRHGVVLTITPDGVRRPVAVAALTFLLALSGRLFEKDRLTREGRWAEKTLYNGLGLTGRTLGLIGLGNIGREVCRLTAPLGMRRLAFDPYAPPDQAAEVGVELADLDRLLRESDFVVITCALTPETRGLIDAERLALLKPSAYLINVARGPIVDQAALTDCLRARRIAGAGLDVFEREPIDPHDPLLSLDNVIVTPHALCWTDELFRGNGRSACASIAAVARGEVPANVVNRDAIASSEFQRKMASFRGE